MLLLALLSAATAQDTSLVFSGRANQLQVPIPRIEATVTVDGVLDEPVWTRAARLTGFSQFQPVDGRPAEETTEVLVWYGPDAIYFGIRASELHGNVVRATRANRDNIASEDHVQILLDTNNDRRLAYLFGVNPLGVQQDGTRSAAFGGGAGGFSATGGGTRNINPLDGNVDLNPDFVWTSRGRLTDGGYEVEIRIPFKSLRYQDGAVQDWGLHILRRSQHSGFQDSWAPAVRANANFLAQAGTLTGLHDMRRGLVLEVTPTTTARLDGSRDASGWNYDGGGELSGDVRWGIRQNLTLSGTVNPDFSQVEADVGQVTLNERFALFYPEKRPFFLDGIELFDTPNQLIYTRRIAAPVAGAKVAGKAGGLNLAALAAVDDQVHSATGEDSPVFGAVRLRRDLGPSSTLGAVATTREDGAGYSRLGGADLRIYHSRLYYVEIQAVHSWTREGTGDTRGGPLLEAVWDRTGRNWGFHYSAKAIGPDFRAAAGFVNRTGILQGTAFNRLSYYGAEGAFIQTAGAFIGFNRTWDYDAPGDGAIEGSESLSPSATLRGGWQVGGNLARSFFAFDPGDYAGYGVSSSGGEIPFTVPGPERNLWSGSVRLTTPTFRWVTATASLGWGSVPVFREAAPGRSFRAEGVVDLRPTQGLRTTVQVTRFTLDRSADGSRYSTETIPRLKVEYQLSRAVFLRVVGQYTARDRTALRDREGRVILLGGQPDAGETVNELQVDWLFSYRPTPGTLFYFGYGSTLREPEEFRFRDLQRRADGFFAKASYLFRL
jgi:hypothetical protein